MDHQREVVEELQVLGEEEEHKEVHDIVRELVEEEFLAVLFGPSRSFELPEQSHETNDIAERVRVVEA
jgi:hypothetical protein